MNTHPKSSERKPVKKPAAYFEILHNGKGEFDKEPVVARAAPRAAPVTDRTKDEQWVRGEVIHVDRFGNLITNIGPETLRKALPRRRRSTLNIVCSGHTIRGVSEAYSDVASGRALALVGSYGLIEISVRDRNASSSLGVERGENVKIGLDP